MPNGRGDDRRDGSRPLFGPGSRRHGMGIEKARNVRGTLRRLLSYFRRYWVPLLIVFVLAMFVTMMALLGPYLMGLAIDKLVAREAAAALLRVVALMIGTYAIAWLAQTGQGVLIATINASILLHALDWVEKNR